MLGSIKTLCKSLYACGLMGGVKTIWWNFKLFPLRQAVKLPLLLDAKVNMNNCPRGAIQFRTPHYRPGLLSIGIENFGYRSKGTTIINISGKLIVHGNARHHFGSNGHLLIHKSGTLELGERFGTNYGWHFMIDDHSIIGDDCMFSWNVTIMDSDGHPIKDANGQLINPPKPVRIGNRVWIGRGASILKGASIPDGSVIATKSIVTRPLPESNTIYVGNKPLRGDIIWERKPI